MHKGEYSGTSRPSDLPRVNLQVFPLVDDRVLLLNAFTHSTRRPV